MDGTGFPYYECLGCDAIFRSPEEQAFEILSEADLITVYALQRASIIKEMEGKYSQAEACLRAIDKIRLKYEGFYEYSYQNGRYKSPYSYTYNANSIDVSIDISTIAIWLGHNSIETTHKYMVADLEIKRKAMEKAGIIDNSISKYKPSNDLLEFLSKL